MLDFISHYNLSAHAHQLVIHSGTDGKQIRARTCENLY